MTILDKKLAREKDHHKKLSIIYEINKAKKMRRDAIATVRQITLNLMKKNNQKTNELFNTKLSLRNHDCYVPVVDKFVEKCINLNNEYVLRNLYVFVNLCESGFEAENIIKAINDTC